MKNKFSLLVLLLTSALPLHADSLYFDVNGTDPGFGVQEGQTYNWNTTDIFWNTSNTGGAGTLSAWPDSSDIAVFSTNGVGGDGYGVNLQENVSVGGITAQNANGNFVSGTAAITISATSARTITLGEGAVISNTMAASRQLLFGDYVNLSGDFAIGGTAWVSILGEGSAYSGTITLAMGSSSRGLQVGNTHRIASTTNLVMDMGRVEVIDGATLTVSKLSGTGGVIAARNSKFVLNQADDTTFSGALVWAAVNQTMEFEKSGMGTLVLDGGEQHTMRGLIRISGGSLYVKSNLTNGTDDALNRIEVAAGANFGGTSTISRDRYGDVGFFLLSATSRVTPGMLNEEGVLTLDNGFSAEDGGTFDFKFNGKDLLNSHIVVTDGPLTLGGTLTANFFDLGTGSGIEAGVAYTIFQADGITVDGWQVNILPDGWAVAENPFSVSGNQLQITFSHVIPEPSVVALLGLAAIALACGRRRNRV